MNDKMVILDLEVLEEATGKTLLSNGDTEAWLQNSKFSVLARHTDSAVQVRMPEWLAIDEGLM